MAHAEALFFIYHQQAEVVELQVLRQKAVSAVQDVDLARLYPLRNRLLSFGGAEPGDHFYCDGEELEAVFKGLEVLEAEHRGWGEHRYLAAILHRFKGGAHGH